MLGAPLGSLSWVLFSLCRHSYIFLRYSATGHLSADADQACVHGSPSSQLLLASKIDLHVLSTELNIWVFSNLLTLNSSKTRLSWFGTAQQLLKLDYAL